MNLTNINHAIAIMQRAKNLDMRAFQASRSAFLVRTEAEHNVCGNTACFAGYVGLSVEFQMDGGTIDLQGMPIFEKFEGSAAISRWLGISFPLAENMVYGNCVHMWSKFYKCPWFLVKPKHVIAKLEAIKAGELT